MDFLKITLYDKQVYQHRNCLPCLKNARIHFWGKKEKKFQSGFQLCYNPKTHHTTIRLHASKFTNNVISTSFLSWIIICSVISLNGLLKTKILQSVLCLLVHKCMNCCKKNKTIKEGCFCAQNKLCILHRNLKNKHKNCTLPVHEVRSLILPPTNN